MNIKIPYDVCNYIQSLQYDVEGLKELLAYTASITGSNNETRDYYLNLYLTKNKEYNLAKQELENMYIKPTCLTYKAWNLDFNSSEVTVCE